MSKVIKISDDVYEKLSMLSDGTGESIANLATGLIEFGLGSEKVEIKTVERQVLVFKQKENI